MRKDFSLPEEYTTVLSFVGMTPLQKKKMVMGGRGSGEREVVFPDFKAMLVRPPFHTHRVALFVVLSPKEMSDSFTSSCLCFCIVLSVVCICVHCRDFPGVQLSF